jgi:hypothetical protein
MIKIWKLNIKKVKHKRVIPNCIPLNTSLYRWTFFIRRLIKLIKVLSVHQITLNFRLFIKPNILWFLLKIQFILIMLELLFILLIMYNLIFTMLQSKSSLFFRYLKKILQSHPFLKSWAILLIVKHKKVFQFRIHIFLLINRVWDLIHQNYLSSFESI